MVNLRFQEAVTWTFAEQANTCIEAITDHKRPRELTITTLLTYTQCDNSRCHRHFVQQNHHHHARLTPSFPEKSHPPVPWRRCPSSRPPACPQHSSCCGCLLHPSVPRRRRAVTIRFWARVLFLGRCIRQAPGNSGLGDWLQRRVRA
jgi:hypothetical protein